GSGQCWVGDLPHDVTVRCVERRPETAGRTRPRLRARAGNGPWVRLRIVRFDVNSGAVGGRSEVDAAVYPAGAGLRHPHGLPRVGVESPVVAALLSRAEEVL